MNFTDTSAVPPVLRHSSALRAVMRLLAAGFAGLAALPALAADAASVLPRSLESYAATEGAGVGEVGREVGLSRRDTVLNETGIAGRMLGYANRLATGYRSATGAARNNVEQQLRSYIDLIEQTRQFSGMYN